MGTIIILYDESEELFTSLGLGVLNDCISCEVSESLNDSFELTLEYPIKGSNYSKIKIGRIIGAKPNPYDDIQPFRIASITKPINGIVTIIAYHLSYDMNGIPCKAVDAASLSETLVKIKENCLIENNFSFKTDVQFARKFKTTSPYNVRAILMGDEDESLIGVYNAELKFDKYSVYLYSKRGKNRGARVCYGNNMIDLTHESTNERLYNGVFPYYHTETETTETSSSDSFTKTYIVGSKPFQDGWLSFSKNGEAYHPVDSTPVQIDTEGEYYEKVYSWNSTYQKYEEKIYNATVTIMEGIIEPSWIVIDWSTFPVVVCRANAKGYFKLATETDWGEIKGVGDVIFQGNILTSGLTNMASNMIIGYSEVLPPNHTSTSQTSVSSVDVVLDDPIIWLNTSDAKTMKYNRVLSLDLTSEFEEQPSKDKLKAKAEEYINKNLVGTAKYSTTVSFIDLSSTTDSEKYSNFEHVEIGDTVKVIYKDLGVDVDLRVISTTYDAITGNYISVELGEKPNKFSANSIQNGDNISSLSNDVGYADITTVNKLIADTVTADYIQAVNASMSNAQIKFLEVAKISCSGIFEASQLVLDEIVAKMLTAENAKISQTLEAGEIKVAGDISVKSGFINIVSDDNSTSFIVDRDGNVTANSLEITGGSITIGENFEVTNDGILTAQDATINGRIIADSGRIGDAYIIDGHLQVDNVDIKELSANRIKGGTLKSSKIRLDAAIEGLIDSGVTPYSEDWLYQEVYDYERAEYVKETIEPEQNTYYYVESRNKYYIWNGTTYEESATEPTYFEVDDEGNVTANSLTITGGTISIAGDSTLFNVTQDGTLEANSVKLSGGEIENLDITGYLFFKSRDYTNAYVMTSVGNTDYSDGYLTYATANNYMEYNGDYAYVDGVLTLTTHGQNDRYHRNYIRKTNTNELSYSIYSMDKLSEHNPTVDNREGPELIPDTDKTYAVMDYKDGYSSTPELLGVYTWNGTSYIKENDSLYYISEDGFYLPYIKSTLTGASIAGFDVDANTITSSTATTEVGISSDISEPAFWAGKEVNGEHPFEVSQLGELITTSGKIADLLIANNYLTSNPDKTSHIYDWGEPGILINSSGITITETDEIFVRMCYGTIIANSIEINWKNLNTISAQQPYLPIKPSKITQTTIDIDNIYYGYEVEDFIYQDRQTFIWNLAIWCKANTWTKISVPSGFYPRYAYGNINIGKDAFENNPININTTILTNCDSNNDVHVLVRYSSDRTFDVSVSIVLEYIPNN